MIKQLFNQAFPTDIPSQELMESIILSDLISDLYTSPDPIISVINQYNFYNYQIYNHSTCNDCNIYVKCFPNSQWTSIDYHSIAR